MPPTSRSREVAMMMRRAMRIGLMGLAAALAWPGSPATAQDRLKGMPGYPRFESIEPGDRGVGQARQSDRSSGRTAARRLSIARTASPTAMTSPRRKAVEAKTDVAEAAPMVGRRGNRPAGPGVGADRLESLVLAGRDAQGLPSRPEPLHLRRERRPRSGDHHRRRREGPDQERQGELGLRRGARPDDRVLVVTRLPRSWPSTASTSRRWPTTSSQLDQTKCAGPAESRTLPQGRHAQPGGRPVRPRPQERRRRSRLDIRDGKPVRGRGGRLLRLQRPLVARRQGAAVPPDQPPPERPGARRGRPRDRQVPRRPPRGMAGELGRGTTPSTASSRTAAISSGPRSGPAGRTTTSTTSAAARPSR